MTRIRSIKPAFWTSQTLMKVSRDARLTFIGLWNEADDDGRIVDSPKRLAGALFGFDDDVDAKWMDDRIAELAKVHALVRYSVAGARYIAIPNFRRHQVINKPRASVLPPPPEDSSSATGGVPDGYREDWNGLEEDWNGMEGSGLEAGAVAPEPPPSAAKPQEPELPPLPSNLTVGGVSVPRVFAGLGGRAGFETQLERGTWFEDVDELLKAHGAEFTQSAPMLDGKGHPKRPTVATFIGSKWGSFVRVRVRDGQKVALDALRTWLSEAAEKHRRSWEAHGGTPVEDPKRERARKQWLALRARGQDLPAFDTWFENLPPEGAKPTPKPEADTPSPEEVRAILAGATSKLTHGAVVRPRGRGS